MKTLVLPIALTLAVTAQADTDPLIAQTLNQYYPVDADASARLARASDGKQRECHYYRVDDDEYCMILHSEKTADSTQDKRRYLLFTGKNLNEGHASAGLAVLFAFTEENGGWRETAHGQTEAGEWGDAPEDWQWQEFGPGYWGAVGKSGFVQGGGLEEAFNILHDDGERIASSTIPATSSYDEFCDPAVEKFCDNFWEGEAGAKEHLANTKDLQATLNIRRDLNPVGNSWPLEITLNGYDGRKITGRENNGAYRLAPIKEYRQEKYTFPYNATKHDYQMPDNYPIRFD